MKYLVRGCEAVEGVANYKNHVENCFYIFLDVFQSRKQVSSIQNVSRIFFLRTAKHRLTEKVKRFVYTFFPCTCTNFFDIIRRRAKCNCYRAQVNTDFGQNTGGYAVLYKCGGTYETSYKKGERVGRREDKVRGSDLLNTVPVSIVMARLCKYYFTYTAINVIHDRCSLHIVIEPTSSYTH